MPITNENSYRRLTWFSFSLISVLALLTVGVRLVDIERSLWLDELHTSWSINGSFSHVWERAADGNQSPIYFWLNWAVVRVFGHTELGIRLLSVLAGTLVVLLTYSFVWSRTQSRSIGFFTAMLVAMDPYFIEYSQEARPYALLQVCALLQIWFFTNRYGAIGKVVIGEKKGGPNPIGNSPGDQGRQQWKVRCGFVVCSIIGFYLHFTSALLTVSLFLVAFAVPLFRGERISKHYVGLVMDFAGIFVGCLPILGQVIFVAGRKENWALFINDDQYDPSIQLQLTGYFLMPFLIWFLVVCRRLMSQRNKYNHLYPKDDEVEKPDPAGAATGTVPLFNSDLTSVVLLAAYFGPMLLSWLALKTDIAPLYLSRYFMSGWIAVFLFLGIQLASLAGNQFAWGAALRRSLLGLAVLIVLGVSSWQNHLFWHFAMPALAVRETANDVKQISEDPGTVLWDETAGAMPLESRWKDVVAMINQQAKARGGRSVVFLMSNLIEDQFLQDPARQELSTKVEADSIQNHGFNDRLVEYCLFPIRGIYNVEIEQCHPRPTLFRARFWEEDVGRIEAADVVWLIIRGNDRIQDDILNELAVFMDRHGLPIAEFQITEFPVKGSPENKLFLGCFDLNKASN
ncbi:glycosyltransferase family 39 protein [Pirellulaceae bacterium]|nr:glycosyltransferase family 39 protein [Pirellulaceae bacterium]